MNRVVVEGSKLLKRNNAGHWPCNLSVVVQSTLESGVCRVESAPILTHICQCWQKILRVDWPSFVNPLNLLKILMHCTILYLNVGVFLFSDLNDTVHSLVWNGSLRVSEVVSKHHNNVFSSINCGCSQRVLVGNLNKTIDNFTNVILLHRHSIASIKKLELFWSRIVSNKFVCENARCFCFLASQKFRFPNELHVLCFLPMVLKIVWHSSKNHGFNTHFCDKLSMCGTVTKDVELPSNFWRANIKFFQNPLAAQNHIID